MHRVHCLSGHKSVPAAGQVHSPLLAVDFHIHCYCWQSLAAQVGLHSMTHRLGRFDSARGHCGSAVDLGFDLSLTRRILAGCIGTYSINWKNNRLADYPLIIFSGRFIFISI